MQNSHFGFKKLKTKKRIKIQCANYLELFCAKTRSKKHEIVLEMEAF